MIESSVAGTWRERSSCILLAVVLAGALFTAYLPSGSSGAAEGTTTETFTSFEASSYFSFLAVSLADERELLSVRPDSPVYTGRALSLFSRAYCLKRLGTSHLFHVRALADSAPDGNGRVSGNVYVLNEGDPDAGEAVMDALAYLIQRRGVTAIGGDIVAVEEATPVDGGGAVPAVGRDGGPVRIHVRPGADGTQPEVSVAPASTYFALLNEARTGAGPGAGISVFPVPLDGREGFVITGTAVPGAPEQVFSLAPRYPALADAWSLRDALDKRKVSCGGRVRQGAAPSQPVTLATHVSSPLSILLRRKDPAAWRVVLDAGLRAIAQEESDKHGRPISAVEALEAFISRVSGQRALLDVTGTRAGSALTARDLVRLLVWVYKDFQLWPEFTWGLAPYEETAQSGTTVAEQSRFFRERSPGIDVIAGYLQTNTGERVALALVINQSTAVEAERRDLEKRLLMRIAEGR
ncbi:MAG: D-alanyl-D-alanine carboxypeptidase [Candidatus Schekmanbacteria bacterium]|nr:D-alanyl-D-alanine carboxypeptidase [Candidatus Schekmanbacteria bacterium]